MLDLFAHDWAPSRPRAGRLDVEGVTKLAATEQLYVMRLHGLSNLRRKLSSSVPVDLRPTDDGPYVSDETHPTSVPAGRRGSEPTAPRCGGSWLRANGTHAARRLRGMASRRPLSRSLFDGHDGSAYDGHGHASRRDSLRPARRANRGREPAGAAFRSSAEGASSLGHGTKLRRPSTAGVMGPSRRAMLSEWARSPS